MKKNQSFEYVSDLSEATTSSTINRESGVIQGVVLLTGDKVSKNKTFYTKNALKEAVSRYEGAKMFIDHPKPGEGTVRSIRDFGGVYKNVRLEEGRFLKADLHLIPNPDMRNLVLPIAEARAQGVGLSIRDAGRGREEDGVFLVEGFAAKTSYSIDLVTEASVNETLYEATREEDEMELTKITLEQLTEGNPALVESIKTAERNAVLKELEEKIKAGEEAPKLVEKGRKALALAESGLPKDLVEKVKAIVEPDHISLETAALIIKGHKEILESLKQAPKSEADPSVSGHGASKKEKNLTEAELPSPDELVRAIQG